MTPSDLYSPEKLLACSDVREIIDFTGGNPSNASMAALQEEGVTALYNILCKKKFAYLADEVGTGKTYQALGLAALIWHIKPDARILFIAPRENVQNDWIAAYSRFFRNNYMHRLGGDDRVSSLLLGKPIHAPVKVENLREWLVLLSRPQRSAAILRHTSFMRPITVPSDSRLREVWDYWKAKLAGYGLHSLPDTLPTLKHSEASRMFNLAFADGLNALLDERRIAFDLVICDEAQCLRNPDNQSNEVLHAIFQGRVERWLFMSATPAHSSEEDIPRVLNHYPQSGEAIKWKLGEDAQELQKQLQNFLVRRSRAYVVGDKRFTKDIYRQDRVEEWAEACTAALPTLAMGLVQKRLIPILAKRSYRYQVGFLANFESLQSSVRGFERKKNLPADDAEAGDASDFYRDNNQKGVDGEAPDSGFVDQLDGDFKRRFAMHLPHPKVDKVVRDLAILAFGSEQPETAGGGKALVFTRRISTVSTLVSRLSDQFHRHVRERVNRCWGRELDWETGIRFDVAPTTPEGTEGDLPAECPVGDEGGTGLLRRALKDKMWLDQFRRTFSGSGRNAMFFEENWLARLCKIGGKDPQAVAAALPAFLWEESLAYAARASDGKTSIARARQMHYLALHALNDEQGYRCFGLTLDQATHWRSLLAQVLPESVSNRAERMRLPETRRSPELFTVDTLWSEWDRMFSDGPLALPGTDLMPEPEQFYRRQVIKIILGQIMRSSDTLIDLKCSDLAAGTKGRLAYEFLQWLAGPDRDAVALRNQYADWIQHCPLILDSALGLTEPLAQLARRTHFEQLNNRDPIVGITGGSGGNKRAIEQFRTPGYPLVIVCTDTLKEGVNLHLFCDKVVHYGLAWTSGDLEQRIGRVDRYFSRIERRLSGAGEPKLDVYYPHIKNSLERSQVLQVIARKHRAEKLMDSPLVSGKAESHEIEAEGNGLPDDAKQFEVDRDFFSGRIHIARNAFATIHSQQKDLSLRKARYRDWAMRFASHLKERGFSIRGNPASFGEGFWVGSTDSGHNVSWSFDPELGRYLFRFESPICATGLPGMQDRLPLDHVATDRPGFQGMILPVDPTLDASYHADLFASHLRKPPRPHIGTLPWSNTTDIAVNAELEQSQYRVQIRFGKRSHLVHVELLDGMVACSAHITKVNRAGGRGPWSDTSGGIRTWTVEESRQLPCGALDLDDHGNLTYSAALAISSLDKDNICRFIRVVGERADTYEAALTGQDD